MRPQHEHEQRHPQPEPACPATVAQAAGEAVVQRVQACCPCWERRSTSAGPPGVAPTPCGEVDTGQHKGQPEQGTRCIDENFQAATPCATKQQDMLELVIVASPCSYSLLVHQRAHQRAKENPLVAGTSGPSWQRGRRTMTNTVSRRTDHSRSAAACLSTGPWAAPLPPGTRMSGQQHQPGQAMTARAFSCPISFPTGSHPAR